MRASVYTEYGTSDVIRLTEMPTPTPKDDEVLIRVRAASVNALDWRLLKGLPYIVRILFRMRRPTIATPGRPGRDVAGRVEAIGRNVTRFKPGDDVFGVCAGAFAEYACASEQKLALKPAAISFEDAAAVPVAAVTALQGLRDRGRIQRGQAVLVDGASGGVGTFAVQIAKSFGAEVTAVCSTRNVDTARAIGADHVIDYTRETFTRSGRRYDLILAANAYHSIFAYLRALTQEGTYVMAGGGWGQIFQAFFLGPFLSRIGRRKISFFMANINRNDLEFLADLLEAGTLVPVIDRRYPLRDVAEAVGYLGEGHARGKVLITMEPRDGT